MPRRISPSRDEGRAVLRAARRNASGPMSSVSLRRDSRDRLNRLKAHMRVDSQSMAIDLVYLRTFGTLDLPGGHDA